MLKCAICNIRIWKKRKSMFCVECKDYVDTYVEILTNEYEKEKELE